MSVGIALLGCGTVGEGVARLLIEKQSHLAIRAGKPLVLRGILVRARRRTRASFLPAALLTEDAAGLVSAPQVQIVVELLGGVSPAKELMLQALAAGKDVVTANKAVLAEHGDELLAAARRHGRTLCFEGSVGGGIPIIRALGQGLAANQIQSIKAILNGTSNFILTQMAEQGVGYAAALAAAQELGLAEADPALDVNGADAAQKLAILARLAFGVSLTSGEIERRGIADMDAADIRFAGEMGCVIKLLAEAWMENDQLALHVEPTLVRRHEPLAEVRGPFNAIEVVGDAVGPTFFYGAGAGQLPTASAVVGDILDLAQGGSAAVFRAREGWKATRSFHRRGPEQIRSRFYLRINVHDRLGVLADVDGVLARHGVSIASLKSHEAAGGCVPVVVMTHEAKLAAVRQAIGQIAALPSVAGGPVYYPVAD
jgi:homoserine dehydrogenase